MANERRDGQVDRSEPRVARCVGLVLEPGEGFHRQVWAGVLRYARPGLNWLVRLMEAGDPQGQLRPTDGLIVANGRTIGHRGSVPSGYEGPVVSVAGQAGSASRYRMELDESAVGELAARHLLERGFSHYAVVLDGREPASERRAGRFAEMIEQAGHEVERLDLAELLQADGQVDQEALQRWLRDRTHPLAVFAWEDAPALRISEACLALKLRVPEDVALLGAGNDELRCQMAYPPLSSIVLPGETLGYEAARMLEALMAGQSVDQTPGAYPPQRVMERASTDVTPIEDADLTAALRYIREHASQPISVEDILEAVPISRRLLEQRFRKLLGRTPLQEIHRVRVEHARSLLSGTDRTVSDVARASGFGSTKRLTVAFRRQTGMSPQDYRKRFKLN